MSGIPDPLLLPVFSKIANQEMIAMTLTRICASLLLVFSFAVSAGAIEMRGELVLNKGPLLEFDNYHREPVCESLLDFHKGKDQPNFFNYRHNNCQGRFTFTLRGDPGSTMTLFGNVDYRKERGFLIVKKLDDQEIWVREIESLPPNRWVSIEGQPGYGSYQVYYAAAPQFSQNIASVKWGTWWTQENPVGGIQ